MKKFRFALLSHVLPPSPSGQSVMLYRILSGLRADEYCLISREPYAKEMEAENDSAYLSARYFDLRPMPYFYRINRLRLWFVREALHILVAISHRVKEIVCILREYPASAIIACSGDIADIPAGYIASRFLRIPFFAYIFDDYVYQWVGLSRSFAKIVAPLIFKHSRGIIGPNEFVCKEYHQRYGATCAVVRNPCDKNELEKAVYPLWPAEKEIITIMYTGAIYHANYDCFRNLIQAVNLIDSNRIEIHIFTAQESGQLENQGIKGRKVFLHSHVPYDQILEKQHKADILFLPLAFDSPISEVIRTSAPGKMGEYLASGRPVLAHVPHDSFVAEYFKIHCCGVVADKNDPAALAVMIENLISNEDFRNQITQNARKQARLDLSPEHAQHQLNEFLDRMTYE